MQTKLFAKPEGLSKFHNDDKGAFNRNVSKIWQQKGLNQFNARPVLIKETIET